MWCCACHTCSTTAGTYMASTAPHQLASSWSVGLQPVPVPKMYPGVLAYPPLTWLHEQRTWFGILAYPPLTWLHEQRTWSFNSSVLLSLLSRQSPSIIPLLFVLPSPTLTFTHAHVCATLNWLLTPCLSILSPVCHFCLTFPDDDAWINVETLELILKFRLEKVSKCLPLEYTSLGYVKLMYTYTM